MNYESQSQYVTPLSSIQLLWLLKLRLLTSNVKTGTFFVEIILSNKKPMMAKMLDWRYPGSVLLALLTIIFFKSSHGAFVDKNPNFGKLKDHFSTLHSHCEGMCYYFDGNGSDVDGNCTEDYGGSLALNCEAILSITKSTVSCGDSALTAERQMICDEVKMGHSVYKLTIGRSVKATDCDKNDSSACKSRVFVAAAFTKAGSAGNVPYFVCSNNRPPVAPVETWVVRSDGSTARANHTTPFKNQAVSTVFSTLTGSGSENFLVCIFYLSTQKYSYKVGAERGTFDFSEDGLSVQLVRGPLSRNSKNNSLNKVYIGNSSCAGSANSALCPISTIWKASPPIDLKAVDAKSPKPPETRATKDDDDLQAMSVVHKDCLERKRFCYVFSHERGCLHKEMCHILVAIQADQEFKKLHFDIISHSIDLPHIVKHVRPSGWASFAFSSDQLMGDDFVFTCGYYGTKIRVYISINLIGSNLYDVNSAYQDLLLNKKYRVGKKEGEKEPRVMCSFDLENLNAIEITKLPFVREGLTFDLVEPSWYALLAYGPKITDTWSISKHTHMEVIFKKFSKELYNEELNSSCRMGSSISLLLLLVTIINFIF